MWGIIVGLGIDLSLYAYNRLTAPKTPAPIPRTRDSLDLPRTEEGTPVPIVYGRCQVKSPVLVWCSDLNAAQGPDDKFITYGLHMLFVAGLPMGLGVAQASQLTGPKLHNVWMGDKLLPGPGQLPIASWWATNQIINQVAVNRPSFLGGMGNGGGLNGTYQWFGGWTDQTFLAPTPSRIGDAMTAAFNAIGVPPSQIPGHRKQLCVAFSYAPADTSDAYINQTYLFDNENDNGPHASFPQGFVLGERGDLGGIAFEISSYGDKVFAMTQPGFDFGGDADPIEVIYDILTNPWGRLGLDVSKIDMPSFLAASTTLKAENHGYSFAHSSSEDAAQVISAILQQIGATMYEEPTTGKFVLNLIRFDYNVATIPAFDESNIIEVSSYVLGAWRDTINEVRVTYTDRANQYSQGVAIAASLANAVGNSNRRRSKEIQYPGVTNGTLAAKLAARDMNVLSTPLGKISFKTNRDAWQLRPGQPFKLSWAEYGLSNVVFRPTKVDLGSLENGTITIDAIQDAFATTYQGQLRSVGTAFLTPYPAPKPHLFVECFRWLAHEAHLSGLINDVDVMRFLAFVLQPTNSAEYFVRTEQINAGHATVFAEPLVDIPRQPYPTTFTLVNSYARELEPYDTTTGIVVQNVAGPLAATFATLASGTQAGVSTISLHGVNLTMIVTASGDMEIVSFESVTSLGGGQYRLNNVWRGLLDTPAIAHAAGERCFMIEAIMIGRRAWSPVKQVGIQIVPCSGPVTGNGEEAIEIFNSAGYAIPTGQQNTPRSFLPLPAANIAVVGEGCLGTIGLPGTAGQFKSCSLLEEGIDLIGYKRDHWATAIRRGDAADDSLADASSTVYRAIGWRSGVYQPARVAAVRDPGGFGGPYYPDYPFHTSLPVSGQIQVSGIRFDLFGQIDVGIATRKDVTYGDGDLGKGGIEINNQLFGWGDPRVSCFAPSWRNLLANVRWSNGLNGNFPYVWNTNNTGSTVLLQGSTFSLSRLTAGVGSFWLGGNAVASFSTGQACVISRWIPRGYAAIGVSYIKNQTADANDTGQLRLATDAGTLVTGTATAAPTATWLRIRLAGAIPASTTFASLVLLGAEVAGGGTANADTAFVESELRIGQFQDNVLGNYSFDAGTLASWTTDSGTWTTPTTIASPSTTYAINSGATNGQLHQDYTPPAGWETGSQAFVTCFRGSTVATNTGEVIVQALDGSNNVLASGTTGAEAFATLNVWNKRTVWCDMPDGTVKVRVVLKGNYTAGASSGQVFDEVALWVSKDIVPRSVIKYDWSAPTVQPTPNSWQSFNLAYPALPKPDYVLGGTNFNGLEMAWTDGVGRTPAKFTGQFGAGVSSVNSYPFVRGSGSAAPHVAAVNLGRSQIAAYKLTDPFTCVVFYRVDEPGFATACGLVGRMDLGQGWGLEINASGQATALLRGAGATSKTVSLARSSTEGGLHMAVLVNDPVAQTLIVYDETGSANISTASGLGDIAGTSNTCHLRLGRDADDRDVLPGQIARAFIFGAALTSGQITSLWNYAKDPTGLVGTYTRSAVAYCSGPSDAAGETMYAASAAQVAIPYSAKLAVADSGNLDGTYSYTSIYKATGYGLALGRAVANRIQSWDFTGGSWAKDASTTLTQGVVDPTGRPRGVTIAGDASNGFKTTGVTVGAVANNVTLSFWARAASGTPTLKVELYSSVPTLITSTTVVLSTLWKRYDVTLAWTGATATCQWRLVSNSGALTFDLGGVVYSGEQSASNAAVPHLIPGPASSLADVTAVSTQTLLQAFNSDGEIVALGVNAGTNVLAVSPAAGTLVQVKNGSNTKNQRELQILNTAKLRLAHTDGAGSPATVNSDLTEANGFSAHVWKGRGRWSRSDLLDTNAPMTAQVAYTDDATGTPQLGGAGRTTAWTNDTTPSTTISFGTGTAAPESVLLHAALVQCRAEKLP